MTSCQLFIARAWMPEPGQELKEGCFGRERGRVALDDFSNVHSVTIELADEERDLFAIEP